MASTPTETPTEQSSPSPPVPPTLEELTRRSARSLLLPYVVGYVARTPSLPQNREVVVIVNTHNWSMTMVESDAISLDSFLREKLGNPPASKASIDAMPVVKVNEEGLECSICLADFDVGGEAKEMPCKHRYHADCIEKWLGIRGSCPMCRFSMPAEEQVSNKTENGNEESEAEAEAATAQVEEEEQERESAAGEGSGDTTQSTFVFHVYFAGRRLRRRGRYSQAEADPNWDSSQGGTDETGDENSASSTHGDAAEIDD
ncbi:hypothetical protein M9H77_15506 [Catharanthus roseus]|uniref:Uncharacterized protein n=1 Tax=Catharanthus roseus TaxID=4058 RepID=A0ACC0AXF5_CATRO|nr:hypothetical protein M9H77_15506 [Catharanthus roseus]